MSASQFRVVFTGEIADGFAMDEVQRSMAEAFKLSEEQVEQLFSGRKAVLKKELDADTAERMREVLAGYGAVASVEPMRVAPAPQADAPPEAPPPPPEPEPAAEPVPAMAPEAQDSGQAGVNPYDANPHDGNPHDGNPHDGNPHDDNPYAPPVADVEVASVLEEDEVHPPERVAFGRGWGWIADGFRLFTRSIWLWIGTTVVAFIGFMALSLVPLVNIFAPSLLGPVIAAGFLIAAHKLARGGEMQFADLFAGFSNKAGPLLGVGAVYLVGTIVLTGSVFAVVLGGSAATAMLAGDPEAMGAALAGPMVLALLVSMALLLPLFALIWFAPALIALHDVPFGQALVWSLKGCFINFLPFLLYGVIMFVVLTVATLPVGLGLLVAVPIMIASVYASYRDIYLR